MLFPWRNFLIAEFPLLAVKDNCYSNIRQTLSKLIELYSSWNFRKPRGRKANQFNKIGLILKQYMVTVPKDFLRVTPS